MPKIAKREIEKFISKLEADPELANAIRKVNEDPPATKPAGDGASSQPMVSKDF